MASGGPLEPHSPVPSCALTYALGVVLKRLCALEEELVMNEAPRRPRSRPRNGVHIKALFRRRFGFTEEALASIGTLFLAWSLFENEVELAIWKLTGMPKPGERPATDRMQSSDRIQELATQIRSRVPGNNSLAILAFQEAANDVLAYRNAIAHGRPYGGATGQMALNNYPLHGELRRRPAEIMYLDPALLDLALEALETLYLSTYKFARTHDVDEGLKLMLSDPHLHSARSAAAEARHIASMINHEKY